MKKYPTGCVARQVSGQDEKGNSVLSVIAKMTYRIRSNGQCVNDIEAVPINEDLVYYENTDEELLAADLDIYSFKKKTDIIVKGNAQLGKSTRRLIAEVYLGKTRKVIQVSGNRKVILGNQGKVSFSEPDFFEKIPLRYDFAYGGWDKIGEYNIESHDAKEAEMYEKAGIDWESGSGYRYPRNPMGKGYLVDLTKEGVDQLELPNLEDSIERLTPNELAAGNRFEWAKMPVPACTDWLNLTWFPRINYFGLPTPAASLKSTFTENKRGWYEGDFLKEKSPPHNFDFLCTNGASLGLQAEYLRGDESGRLINMHPKKNIFDFKLPGKIPVMRADGRNGKLTPTDSILHTIVIEPEENRLSLVWRGSAKAIRPYSEEELKIMPFEIDW